jgi:type II secretory pathway pseudopilin PulG
MRILTISASLLPDEIVAARQARRTRGWVIVVVAVVAGLCAGWFVYAHDQKQDAQTELEAATTAVANLQNDQRGYGPIVKVNSDTALINEQLTKVMANDLDWAALLDTLRSAGRPSGITIDGVNGTLKSAGDTASTTTALPGARTAISVGSLVVTGSGPDKKSVAAYADALGEQTVVANPYVTSVASADGGGVSFSLRVDIASASLCGRFTVACQTQGGN